MKNIFKEELMLLKAIKEVENYKKLSPQEKREYDKKESSCFTLRNKEEFSFSALASLF